MKDVLHLAFDGLERPIALVDCRYLFDHFPLIFRGWHIDASPDHIQSPILTLRLEKSTYILEADWLIKAERHTDKVDAICALAANLVSAYVRGNAELLCLHGGAANFAGKLVVFPSKYRAGKSILSACLAAANIQLFCDDVLPISIVEGHGIAPGLAPRLRIPLPDNLSPESRDFIQSRKGLEGKQYLYLDLDNDYLAVRSSRAPVGAFVLLEREGGATVSLEEISETEVLHQVVWQNFARKAEAPQILERLSQLVSSAQRFRMRYDRAEDAVALLKETFKDWPSKDLERPDTPLTAVQNIVRPEHVLPGCYLRKTEISIVTVDGESFLADTQGATIHHLNPVGSAIWTLLAEPVAIADLVELLLTAFPDVDGEQIKNDVAALIDTLMSKNLLLVGSNQAQVP
ncbi:MAG: PqqD family protein [Gammaproteobacteria bacterium]